MPRRVNARSDLRYITIKPSFAEDTVRVGETAAGASFTRPYSAERERPIQRWLGLASAALLGVGAVGAVLASPAVEGLKAAPASAMTLQRLGAALFRDHLLGFEVAGLLLLAAMVAAVLLVKKEV